LGAKPETVFLQTLPWGACAEDTALTRPDIPGGGGRGAPSAAFLAEKYRLLQVPRAKVPRPAGDQGGRDEGQGIPQPVGSSGCVSGNNSPPVVCTEGGRCGRQ